MQIGPLLIITPEAIGHSKPPPRAFRAFRTRVSGNQMHTIFIEGNISLGNTTGKYSSNKWYTQRSEILNKIAHGYKNEM